MTDSPPMWLMGAVAGSMFIHGALTIVMITEIRRMANQVINASQYARNAAHNSEACFSGVSHCHVAVDRLDESVTELVGEINEHVFRLTWQQDAQQGRRNR